MMDVAIKACFQCHDVLHSAVPMILICDECKLWIFSHFHSVAVCLSPPCAVFSLQFGEVLSVRAVGSASSGPAQTWTAAKGGGRPTDQVGVCAAPNTALQLQNDRRDVHPHRSLPVLPLLMPLQARPVQPRRLPCSLRATEPCPRRSSPLVSAASVRRSRTHCACVLLRLSRLS